MNDSLYPKLIAEEAVSPPPIITILSLSLKYFKISLVPLEYLSISEYPKGPFHTIVLQSFNFSLNNSIDFSPISSPISSLSKSSLFFKVISLSNSFDTIESTGNIILLSHLFT